MKLLKSIIEKKLHIFDTAEINDNIKFWDFYQACNIVGGFDKKQALLRNSIWNEIFQGNDSRNINLKILINKDRKLLYSLLNKYEEAEKDKIQLGNFYKKGRIAIADYEY